jgi:hypothetical protein
MVIGIRTQGTSITIAHTFSHGHCPRNRIGRVKTPFMMPETMAHAMPKNKTDAERCMNSYSEFIGIAGSEQAFSE